MSKKSQAARVYEDFQPKYELREEQEKDYLTVHLIGFSKDQVNITCKRSARKLTVHGERRLPNNKWSRFNQDYSIPQNCDIDKLDAWWQKGVLTVTMPKEEPKTPLVPSKETALDQPTKSSKDHELDAQKGRDHETAEAQVDSTTSAMKQSEVTKSPSEKDKVKKDDETAAAVNGLSMKKSHDAEMRKLMINLAVAMAPVFVGLVAYISYRLGSKAN